MLSHPSWRVASQHPQVKTFQNRHFWGARISLGNVEKQHTTVDDAPIDVITHLNESPGFCSNCPPQKKGWLSQQFFSFLWLEIGRTTHLEPLKHQLVSWSFSGENPHLGVHVDARHRPVAVAIVMRRPMRWALRWMSLCLEQHRHDTLLARPWFEDCSDAVIEILHTVDGSEIRLTSW